MRQLCFTLVFALTVVYTSAQPSTEKEIEMSWTNRKKLAANSILKNYPVRCLGPSAPGGRVVDIDVNPFDSKEFYVALASGGIFKTSNNGVTFQPIFDHVDALGIGDIAVCPTNPEIILAGTGEKNSSRSSYAGSGIYKSLDGGQTWQSLGLTGTQHISRIVFHPKDPDTFWVAAIGALFSHNRERGLYKTIDAGKTWRKTLYINDSTGVIDVALHPENPNWLLASTWERTRKAGDFKAAGPGSAIYRSEDGGETWTKSVAGFPKGHKVGRIGLSVCAGTSNVVYAVLDSQEEVPNLKKQKKLSEEKKLLHQLSAMSKKELAGMDNEFLETVLKQFNIQNQYTPDAIRAQIKEGAYTPAALAKFFESFHSASTKILGAQVYRSDDFGKTWQKRNEYDLDGVYYSYGYYFGEIMVSPQDPDLVYLQGIRLLKSRDGGRSWHRLDTIRTPREVHVDHHAMWIDPADPKHMLLGNDGGVYQTYDEGATWLHMNSISAGQFYTVNVDMEKPYNIYGGLQDNGVWKGSSDGAYWKQLFSGDGMFVIPDPASPSTIFTGYHYGNYFRMEMDKKKSVRISPLHQVDEPVLRWNWRSPLMMSRHNGSLYIGANRLFQSTDKGESWKMISPDLTKNKKQGNVSFSTLSAIAESPLQSGVLYVGADDGNVSVTQDGGKHWVPVTDGLPAGKFVSSIFPSPHEKAMVFISLNGFREDDFSAYLFQSKDFGKTWTSITGNLPDAPANVILQDPVNPSVLYCGLDNGTYASIDGGENWHVFNNLLNVACYDMVIHPRENELVVATHGRGVFIADLKPLQALRNVKNKIVVGLKTEPVKWSEHWGEQKSPWEKPHMPGVDLAYYTGRDGQAGVVVMDASGKVLKVFEHQASAGFNFLGWNLCTDEAGEEFLGKGKYTVRYSIANHHDTVSLEIK